jgi:hypothetical protein
MPNRSGWGATALFLFAVLIAAGALALNAALRPASTVSSIIAIPPAGEVSAAQLEDGHPVFVVHHADGEVSVLDAFSTHVPSGIYKMVAWCPEARIFTDLVHGARYDEWGKRTGGPALGNMNEADWQPGSTGHLVVEDRFTAVSGSARSDDSSPDLGACTFLVHTFRDVPQYTPAAATSQADGSWVIVAGRLDADGHRLCGLGSGCPAPAAIDGLELYPEASNRQGVEMWIDSLRDTQQWLARVANHHLAHVTMLGPEAAPSVQ